MEKRIYSSGDTFEINKGGLRLLKRLPSGVWEIEWFGFGKDYTTGQLDDDWLDGPTMSTWKYTPAVEVESLIDLYYKR